MAFKVCFGAKNVHTRAPAIVRARAPVVHARAHVAHAQARGKPGGVSIQRNTVVSSETRMGEAGR